MPYGVSASNECRQFCRSTSICASFFATIWCINMLVSAVTSLQYVNKYFDEWIEVDALIVGRNVTVHYREENNGNYRRLMGSSILNLTAEDQGKQTWLDDNATRATDGMNDIVFLDDIANQTDADTDFNQTQSNNTDFNHTGANNTSSNNNLGDNTINDDVNDYYTNRPTSAPTNPPITPGTGGRWWYCAEVQFQIDDNTTITAVSDTYCSFDSSAIVIGNTFVVLYDPALPEEIIEESLYAHASNSLRVTVAVSVLFTLGYLFCSLYLYRSQPCMARTIFSHPGQDSYSQDANPNGQRITQSPEEREALMETKFFFQTVLEDLSNTVAASIKRLFLEEEDKIEEDCRNQDAVRDDHEESCLPATKARYQHQENDLEVQQAQQSLHQQDDLVQQEEDMELNDVTKKDTRDQNSTSNSETETETDTDVDSNIQSSDIIESQNDNSKQPQQPLEQESAWSITGATNLIASWTNAALAPPAPECCICLESYQAGDAICTSKKDGCEHVFHKQCIEAWLHNHDCCPLCRVDLMN